MYITHFSRNIVSVFIDSYALVDAGTQKSFERLLHTWKNGMPNGGPVFARHIIESMERSVTYIRQKNGRPPLQPPPPTNAPMVPSPQSMPRQPMAPQQQQQLQHHQQQQQHQTQQQQPIVSRDPRQRHAADPATGTPPPKMMPPQPVPFMGQIFQPIPSTPPNTSMPPQQAPAPPAAFSPSPVDTNALLASLMSKGIIGQSPLAAALATASPPNASGSPSATLRVIVKLDSKDLQRTRPNAVECLYADLPLKCKQCGIRYPDTHDGETRMDAHLDSHFRQNRRMKDRGKRGLSRSWFVSVDDWIEGAEGQVAHQQMPVFMSDKHDGATDDDRAQKSDPLADKLALEECMVVKPANDADRVPCPICGEPFVDVWNDEQEEWMYKNSVLVDGKIYHATCRADVDNSNGPPKVSTPQKRKLDTDSDSILAKVAKT
ncbi:hypothetical protein BC940DRAFT_71500 [Gongronella butleri]|nr:hypothetical protein BC940DRAFT_71500 [Gongronella butleri]